MDIGRIVCDVQHMEWTRCNFSVYSLTMDMKEHRTHTEIQKYLFGKNCPTKKPSMVEQEEPVVVKLFFALAGSPAGGLPARAAATGHHPRALAAYRLRAARCLLAARRLLAGTRRDTPHHIHEVLYYTQDGSHTFAAYGSSTRKLQNIIFSGLVQYLPTSR